MYGERGKIGLIVPSNNTVVEREFNRLLPADCAVVATRMMNTRTEKDDLEQMAAQAERGGRELSTAGVHVVAFACTSGSFMHGPEWEAQLQRTLESAARCRVVTTSASVVEALRTLTIGRVVVATPYPDDINELERRYLEAQGIEVLEIRGLGIRESVKIGHCAPDAARELVMRTGWERADGIFISCTNFRTIDVIQDLEDATGKPVVSSNQATFWKCMRELAFPDPIHGCGRLLAGAAHPVAR